MYYIYTHISHTCKYIVVLYIYVYILVLHISTYPAGFMSQAADSGHQCKVRSLSMSARQGYDARGIFKKKQTEEISWSS